MSQWQLRNRSSGELTNGEATEMMSGDYTYLRYKEQQPSTLPVGDKQEHRERLAVVMSQFQKYCLWDLAFYIMHEL